MSTPIVLKKQKCGHRKVCRDIESLACSSDFNTANFGRIEYVGARSRKQRANEILRKRMATRAGELKLIKLMEK